MHSNFTKVYFNGECGCRISLAMIPMNAITDKYDHIGDGCTKYLGPNSYKAKCLQVVHIK